MNKKGIDWISNGTAYIFILEGDTQNCVIDPQISLSEDDWIPGYAGIIKAICLYEKENGERILVLDYLDRIETMFKDKHCLFIDKCIVTGPKMVVNPKKILIIEESKIPLISNACFDEKGNLIEEEVIEEINGLKKFWSKGTGFQRS